MKSEICYRSFHQYKAFIWDCFILPKIKQKAGIVILHVSLYEKKMEGVLLEGLLSIKETVQNLSISMELCPINLGLQLDEEDFGDIEQVFMPF